MKPLTSYRYLFCGLSFAVSLAGAQATLIFSDDFSGSSGNPLIGSTTTVGGGVWEVNPAASSISAGWHADGSVTAGTTSSPGPGESSDTPFAFLPVTIATGNIYELSVSSLTNTSISSWVGLAFSSQNSTVNLSGNPPLALLHTNGQFELYPWGVITDPGSNSHSIRMTLDTTGDQWSTAVYLDGSAIAASTYTYPLFEGDPRNPTITYIGLIAQNGATNGTGSVSNFMFQTIAVPEPSSIALLVLGLAPLLLLRRRSVKVS